MSDSKRNHADDNKKVNKKSKSSQQHTNNSNEKSLGRRRKCRQKKNCRTIKLWNAADDALDQTIPEVTYRQSHRLKLLQTNRIRDWLIMEEEYLTRIQRSMDELSNHRNETGSARHAQKINTNHSTNVLPALPAAIQMARQQNQIHGQKPLIRKNMTEPSLEEQITIDLIRDCPMVVGQLEQIINHNHVIASLEDGSEWYMPILSIVDRHKLIPNCRLLLRPRLDAVVGVLPDHLITEGLEKFTKITLKPNVKFEHIGGLDAQIREIKETIELPLIQPELFESIGISAPKGILLYGPPGTGKTMLAKAVANSTQAAFFYTSASKLAQKTLGDGPRLVRELFKMATINAPSIVFIDEIDAIGSSRKHSDHRNDEREIHRTMLELLNQLDGFEPLNEIKVILATNRIDLLDPALIRPGRIDRKIAIPAPDWTSALRIFRIQTSQMRLAADVKVHEILAPDMFAWSNLVDTYPCDPTNQSILPVNDSHSAAVQSTCSNPNNLYGNQMTGADIADLCTQAGLFALRSKALQVQQVHFLAARDLWINKRTNQCANSMFN